MYYVEEIFNLNDFFIVNKVTNILFIQDYFYNSTKLVTL